MTDTVSKTVNNYNIEHTNIMSEAKNLVIFA